MSIKQLDDASKAYRELLDKMASIDKKYSSTYQEQTLDAPETLGLEKLTYTMPTDDEIAEIARQYYAASKAKDEQNVNTSAAKQLQSIEAKTKSVLEKALEGQTKVEAERKEDLKNADYSAQKRNLTNSSVRTGALQKVNDLADATIATLERNKENSLAALDREKLNLDNLTKEQLAALEKIYEEKILSKIGELKEDAARQADSVAKYNNSVDEKEANYQKSLAKQLKDLEEKEWARVQRILELTEKLGATGVERQKEREKYEAAKRILDQYPPETAYEILTSTAAFSDNLGSSYDQLKSYYKNLTDRNK